MARTRRAPAAEVSPPHDTDVGADIAAWAATSSAESDPELARIYTSMLQSDLALFAKVVLGIEIGPHILAWSDLVAQYRRIAVNAARDHSKCHPASTRVLRADGARVPIAEWRGGDVLALDEDKKLRSFYAPAAQRNGRKPVLRITTRTGRITEVTHNHPLLKYEGWVRADSLVRGDRIAVPRKLPTQGRLPFARPWLAGLLVGNGCLTSSTVTVSTADPCVVDAVRSEAAAAGWQVSPKGEHGYSIHADWVREGSPLQWSRSIGLQGHDAYTKRVPLALFQAPLRDVAEFLAGYLDSDGCVNPHAGGVIVYGSVSRALLDDVRHLLLRLGVVSSLTENRTTYEGEPYTSWILSIRGESIAPFAEHIFPRGKRAEQLRDLVAYQNDKTACSGPCVDLFPRAVWAKVQHSNHWFEKRGLPRPNQQYEPTRAKLRRIAEAEHNAALLQDVNADIFWEEILLVEDIGEQETWALCVPGPENYVADDVINHNSTFFAYAYPIWRAWSEPGCEVYLFSNTLEQAQEFLSIIIYGRNNLKGMVDIPALESLVPTKESLYLDRKARLNRSDVRFTNGSRIRAVGYGKAIRGRHPRYIVLDDPLNDEDMWSETTRRKNIEYFRSAITNMLAPDGQMVVVGTPYHVVDLYGWLRSNKAYAFARYPGILRDLNTGAERALFPWRWTLKKLQAKKDEIGPVAFTREILCLPVSDDISIFPGYLFPPCFDTSVRMRMPREQLQALGAIVYFGIDIARSASVGADYFVIFVIAKLPDGRTLLVDIRRTKGLSFQRQLQEIELAAALYDPSLIYIENNAMQQVYTDELRRTTDLPVRGFTTLATNKYPLDKGVPSLRITLEGQKLIIPRGDAISIQLSDLWIEECTQFGFVDGKMQGVGEHDDTVMAWWIANEAMKAGGFSFAFGSDQEQGAEEESAEGSWEDVMLGPEPTETAAAF